eukprot:4411217-Pyramimonas_sp.AAC.1
MRDVQFYTLELFRPSPFSPFSLLTSPSPLSLLTLSAFTQRRGHQRLRFFRASTIVGTGAIDRPQVAWWLLFRPSRSPGRLPEDLKISRVPGFQVSRIQDCLGRPAFEEIRISRVQGCLVLRVVFLVCRLSARKIFKCVVLSQLSHLTPLSAGASIAGAG